MEELEDIRLFFFLQGIYIWRMGKIIMPVLIFYKVVYVKMRQAEEMDGKQASEWRTSCQK